MTATNVIFYNTSSDKRVTIGTAKVEYTMNNAIGTPISIPSTDETSTESTKIVNLLKIVERFIVDGSISTGLNNQAGSPVERTNAKDVKNDLVTISKTRAVKADTDSWNIMTYDGDNYYVTFEKISIREDAIDIGGIDSQGVAYGGEVPDGVMRYNVKISVVVGEPIV